MVSNNSSGESSTPYYFLLVFWGNEFCDLTCRYAIPSLLAPGNIPSLKGRSVRFLVATTARDWENLQTKPIFQELQKHIPVEFIAQERLKKYHHKYERMSAGHAILTDRCFHDKASAININPDSIYPDGCVSEAVRLRESGKDVILCAAVRFDMEGVDSELTSQGMLVPGKPIDLPMREAVRVGLRHLHPETLAANWAARNFGRLHHEHKRAHFLTCCYWEVPGEGGVIILTHNWSPFLVNYAVLGSHDTGALDGRALDGNYIFENFPAYTQAIHVVQDSDSIFLLGLSPHEEMEPPDDRFWWKESSRIGEWTRGFILNRTVFDPCIDEYRRRIYQLAVRWHSKDVNERWLQTENEANRLICEYVQKDIEALGNNLSFSGICRWIILTMLDPIILLGHSHLALLLLKAKEPIGRVIFGRRPFLRIWHPMWLDTYVAAKRLRKIKIEGNGKILSIGSGVTFFKGLCFERTEPDLRESSEEFQLIVDQANLYGGFDACFFELIHAQADDFRNLYERFRPYVRNGGTIFLYLKRENYDEFKNCASIDLVSILPEVDERRYCFFGGKVHFWLRIAILKPTLWFPRYLGLARALSSLFLLIEMPVALVSNLVSSRRDASKPLRHWSSILVEFKVRHR